MYHVPWIALISAKRWRLDVLTFLIHGFDLKLINLPLQYIKLVVQRWKRFPINLVVFGERPKNSPNIIFHKKISNGGTLVILQLTRIPPIIDCSDMKENFWPLF